MGHSEAWRVLLGSRRNQWIFITLCLLYVGAGHLGIAVISFPPGNLTPIWLASGFGFVLIAQFGWKGFVAVVMGSMAVNGPFLLTELSARLISLVGVTALVDASQGALAYLFIRNFERFYERRLFSRADDLYPFLWRVCLLPCALTVWLFVVLNEWAGVTHSSYSEMAAKTLLLTFSDSMGLFLVAPIYWLNARTHALFSHTKTAFFVAMLIVPLLITYFLDPQFLIVLIPIFLIAFNTLRWRGAVYAMFIIAPALYWMATTQSGFFFNVRAESAPWMAHLVVFCVGAGAHYLGLLFEMSDDVRRELELRVKERTTELEALNVKLKQLATHDELTQILNRREWRNLAGHEIAKAKRYRLPCCVLLFDIDHFKKINDQWGHAAGDAVLLEFVSRIIQRLRETDLFGRYGGEEFVVFLPNTEREHAYKLAERLRQSIAVSRFSAHQVPIEVTTSVGMSTRLPEDNLDTLLARADSALYRAKDSGRNCVRVTD